MPNAAEGAEPGLAGQNLIRTASITFGIAAVLIAGLVAAGLAAHDNPGRYFGEGRPGTTATVVAFLVAGVAAWMIRGDLRPDRFARLWLMAAIGFVYLALDDQFKVHENLDVLINNALGRDPEGEGDSLDNYIVAAYGPIAAAIALPYRRELLALRRFVGFMALGFVLYVAMVLFDSVAWPPESRMDDWALTLEESCKLLAAVSMTTGVLAARVELARRRRGA